MNEQVISSAEWQVMRVIWAHPGVTSQQVIQGLEGEFDWQVATIKTLLGRLKKKGFVAMEKDDSKYHYYPTISESEHLKRQLTMILENMCSTKHGELVQDLLLQGQFSKADLADLAQQIADKSATAPETIPCHCLASQCTCGHHGHHH